LYDYAQLAGRELFDQLVGMLLRFKRSCRHASASQGQYNRGKGRDGRGRPFFFYR
jgi:hypothetical protein